MNLDELMAVWKSQDAAPLHDVNKTLLHLALRQDEAMLQKTRCRERWMTYIFSAGIIAAMALFLAMMIYFHRHRPEKMVTGWDYAVPVVGAAAALLAGGAAYMGHRAQARREQRFGESLRDQINRGLAQIDDVVTGTRRRSVIFVLMGMIWPMAILHLGMRINDKSLGDVSCMTVALLILCFLSGARSIRRSVPRAIARKRQLEELLKELDGK